MKLVGTAEVAGPRETVFDQLLDPEILARCIPGCESMTATAPGAYQTQVRAGVGPIKGSFAGEVALSDIVRGESYRMSVKGKSTVGYVDGGAAIRLESTGEGTRVHYDGDAKISGKIAAIGSRLIDAAAKTVARQFFTALAREVSERQTG